MKLLVINVIWLIAFFIVAVFQFSISETPTHRHSTSLAKRSSDLLPTIRYDSALVATLDGTLSLVEIETQKILWSIKTGLPIYSSYQASQNLDVKLETNSEFGDDIYIDCGDDWNLYKHDRTKGIVERLKSAKDLVRETKELCNNGTAVISQMATTVLVVDVKTGTIIRTVRFSDSSRLGFEDGENPLMLKDDSTELISITRTDYSFLAYSKLSGKVLWNVTLAEFDTESLCKVENPTLGDVQDQHHVVYKGDSEMHVSCLKHTLVYRIRDPKVVSGDGMHHLRDYSPLSVVAGKIHGADHESSQVLALPSPENYPSISPSELLALPSSKVQAADYSGNITHPGSSKTYLSPILSGLILVLSIGSYMYQSVFSRENKHSEDPMSKTSVAKKKKPRKSANNKNNSNGNNVSGGALNVEVDGGLNVLAQSTLGSIVGGRNIGKLWVTSNEIAMGSNGTIVLEGVYDGRHVAVKRLVRTHHDVALKEIQNLMASDQHPNVVRFYGVEFDSDFVYLSLERCMSSLNDWIGLHSCSSQNALSVYDANVMGIELWKSNGYPSHHLLKLMRDVVSGVAHLHELGFIHRDLKPHNVLVTKEKVFCAKISDMGISKRLIGDVTSLTHHATGAGSSGWQAPEQILHGRHSLAVDLFSLGCVLFFCMTGGKHPFGDVFERDANIVKNRVDLFLLDHVPEAVDLITRLLDPNPEFRPKAADVLQHPLFWNSEKRLSFLRDASDRVELEDRESHSELLEAVEATASVSLNGRWDEKLESSFLTNMSRYRRYKYNSIRDLLRVIRNKLNHYRELPSEIQQVLGSVPEGFDNYFTTRFPKLLIEVYTVMYAYCHEEELFGKYFKSSLL